MPQEKPPEKPPLSIDLDAMRAARREKLGQRSIRFGGKTHELPVELPAEYAFAWAQQRFHESLAVLLGDEAANEFAKWASLDDFWELGRAVEAEYKVGQPGES